MPIDVAKNQLTQDESSKVNKSKRDKLIIDHLPLVKYIVGKMMICLPPHVDQEDLNESGILGLIEAADKFNENKQVKFKTYAFHRIRGSIIDYLRFQDWVPRSVREKERLIKDVYNTLEQKLNRSPQVEEVAEEMGISCDQLDKIFAEINVCSLLNLEDIKFGKNDETGIKTDEIIKDNQAVNPLDVLETKEELKILENTLSNLNPKERMVLTLYYYEDMLLKEIAEVMNLSESRISQLHHRALITIRSKVKRTNFKI